MTDSVDITADETGSGSHWLRWLVLIAIAIGAIAAGRKIALNSADTACAQLLHDRHAPRDSIPTAVLQTYPLVPPRFK